MICSAKPTVFLVPYGLSGAFKFAFILLFLPLFDMASYDVRPPLFAGVVALLDDCDRNSV